MEYLLHDGLFKWNVQQGCATDVLTSEGVAHYLLELVGKVLLVNVLQWDGAGVEPVDVALHAIVGVDALDWRHYFVLL
jgi:hypothetical protein